MEVIKTATHSILEELTKSKVEVIFTGDVQLGYPSWGPGDDTYEIETVDPKETGGLIAKEFLPFSITINEEYKSPTSFPFNPDPRYKSHIEAMRDNVVAEINSNINLRIGKWDILDYMSTLEFELNEIRNNFKVQEEEIFDEGTLISQERHIETNSSKIYDNSNIKLNLNTLEEANPYISLYMHFALSRYWEIQIATIERLLRIIDARKAIIEKTNDYVKEINSLSSQSSIQWTKTDTDLLELIIALYEVGAIQNTTKDLTQKEAIQSFSDFFDIEIKDQYKKLNSARNRKKEDPGIILRMQKALESYFEGLNKRM
jgi:hypothetical protein